MQTTFGVFISWPFVIVASVMLTIIVLVNVYRRGERRFRYLGLSLGELVVAFIAWQILFVVFRFITYTGGSASEIQFKHSLSNIAAYLVIIGLLIFFENKRSILLKQLEG